MTDDELDGAIAQALDRPNDQAIAALTALRDRAQAERDPVDPGVGRVWDALVRASRRSANDLPALLEHSEGRARWLSAARGPDHPKTIQAWSTLAEIANLECAWDIMTRACQAIVNTPISETTAPAVVGAASRALRGLGARSLADRRFDDARDLFARDLALRERSHPSNPAQVARSLDSLALVLELLGDRTAALALRTQQRAVLAATDASASQLQRLDDVIARLSAPG